MPRNASKPKRKLKTHRGAAKRFKLTATGKLLRMHSGKRHLLGTKAAKRMRKLKKITQVNPADKAKTLQMLPYGFSSGVLRGPQDWSPGSLRAVRSDFRETVLPLRDPCGTQVL